MATSNGYNRLKARYSKLEEWIAEREELIREKESIINEQQDIINKQASRISQLTADVNLANWNLEATKDEHSRQIKAMYKHMGLLRRFLWDRKHAPQKAN